MALFGKPADTKPAEPIPPPSRTISTPPPSVSRPTTGAACVIGAKTKVSGEINSTVKDPAAVIPRIEEKYRGARILKMDGINVDYDDWHFNVRGSNTEPLLRLNLEAATPAEMQRRRDEVLQLIRS